jgi:TrmH family RNA methyltransferase
VLILILKASFCIAFAFHYFDLRSKVGVGSEKQNQKLRYLFCFSLALHYLCNMISKNKQKLLRQLEQKKHRAATGLFLAEGPKVVGDLLAIGPAETLIATEEWATQHPDAETKEWIIVNEDELRRVSFLQHPQQVMGIFPLPKRYGKGCRILQQAKRQSRAANPAEHSCGRNANPAEESCGRILQQAKRQSRAANPPELCTIALPHHEEDMEEAIRHITSELCLALDGVQDPGNVGTIIRIADWFGIQHIYCSPDTADAYSPKVVQATMGSIARVEVVYTDLNLLATQLPEGTPVYGTVLDGENLYSTPLTPHGLLVMGNEGKGISARMASRLTHRLLIPPYPAGRATADSLNVAIATAICCAEFRRVQSS